MSDLDDLTTPLTEDDVKRAIYTVLANTGVDTTMWKPGGVVRTLISGVSKCVSALSQLMAMAVKSGFLSTATGGWLKQTAQDVFNVTPLEATFATSTITVVNSGGGDYTLDASDITVTNPTTKQSFFNTASVHIGPLSTVSFPVQAFQAGSVANSFAGEITQIQSPALLGVAITANTAAVGVDAESDVSIRQRCLDKLGSLSPNGPSDAYAFIARSAVRPDGTPIGVTRVRCSNDGLGNVYVYLATASGGVPGTVGDLTTDLGIIDDQLQRMAAPLAVTLHTLSATPITIPVAYSLWIYNTSGLTASGIQETIAANLTAFITSQPIGGNVIGTSSGAIYKTALEACIGGALTPQGVPLNPIRVVLNNPTADVPVDVSQVPIIGVITATEIVQLPPAGL